MKRLVYLLGIFCLHPFHAEVFADEVLDQKIAAKMSSYEAQRDRTVKQRQVVESLREELRRFKGTQEERKPLENRLKVQEENFTFAFIGEHELRGDAIILKAQKDEAKKLAEHSRFTSCNASTPEINLEKSVPFPGANFKGPFFGIPRDNQDGLGTCYANTAKNLLIGLSEGKDIASFLDLALRYKSSGSREEFLKDALDAGNSCKALFAIKEKGFCPQDFSPMENGERNELTESLFHHDSLSDFDTNISAVRNFFTDANSFMKSETHREMLRKTRPIIDRIKANPSIRVPILLLDRKEITSGLLWETYGRGKSKASYYDFVQAYQIDFRKLRPQLIKAVLDGKNYSEVSDMYFQAMKGTFKKFKVPLDKEFSNRYRLMLQDSFNDSNFRNEFKASIQLLKEVSNQQSLSDSEFADYCATLQSEEVIKVVNMLAPLVKNLKSELNEDALFNSDGDIKEYEELLQITIAPSCLHPENRRSIDYPVACNIGTETVKSIKSLKIPEEQKVQKFRDRVVMSLVQGMPLGNSFQVSSNLSHINTIVGLRFNPQSNQCEYLIRESQTGTSDWESERQIFNKINNLVEVRRK